MQNSKPTALPNENQIAEKVGPILVGGFATTVAMWCVGYVTHFPGVTLPTGVIGLLLIITQLAGTWLNASTSLISPSPTGKATSAQRLKIGIGVGLLSTVLNLMILGSVLPRGEGEEGLKFMDALLIIVVTIVLGAVIGAIGGLLANTLRPFKGKDPEQLADHFHPGAAIDLRTVWLTRFAWVAAASVLPVLLSGGIVTSHDAGLAVPDWPNSFSENMFLYPLSKMTGGIYYEHTHRLFGSLAGFTVLTLMVFTMFRGRTLFMRAASVGLLVLIIIQGVMGGVRVTEADGVQEALTIKPNAAAVNTDIVGHNFAMTTDNAQSLGIAIAHGVTGQLTFAALCAFAAVLALRTCTGWKPWRELLQTAPAKSGLLTVAAVFLLALTLQLGLGASARHLGRLGNDSGASHAVLTHLAFAFVVLFIASGAAFTAMRRTSAPVPTALFGKAIAGLIAVQIGLGFVALALVTPYEPFIAGESAERPPLEVLVATTHQFIGALLIGSAAVLAAWGGRTAMGRPSPTQTAENSTDSSSPASSAGTAERRALH